MILEGEIKVNIGKGRMTEAHNHCGQQGPAGIGMKKRDYR